jgi:DNA-binding NarL/FixJ family response regulator
MTITSMSNAFGEIDSLKEVFLEAKKRRPGRHPAHVLVVEDDPLTRRIVAHALREAYAMISACNAQEAVAEYLSYAPDAVFLDIGLPDISGFDVLDQIMKVDPDAFVVMFSSNDYPENVQRAHAAGAKGFVSKPFKKEMLKNYIQGSALHHHKSYA